MDEDVPRTNGRREGIWVPAFAGNRREKKTTPFVASRHFPQRGKILDREIFPLWGKYRRSRVRGSTRS